MYNINILDLMPEYIFFRDIDGKNIYCNNSYAKKSVSYEQTVQKSGGLEPHIEVNKYISLDDKGNLNGILGVIRDTSYKRELDRLREGFFSNLRHEFRTPLNMIFSNIQLIKQRCLKCTSSNESACKHCLSENIEHIYNNSLRLLKLSNNFIDLTEIESGSYSFNPSNYEVISFVERICDGVNNLKKIKNINLIFDTDVEELIVRFDYLKLERAILNLISNAIKFNTENESVIVSITHNSNFVNISIRDYGVGIPRERLEQIFNTFYNVEERLTKISEGSGVGLCLSKHLIEIHNGKLTVNSELDKGTDFIISIPNVHYNDNEIDLMTLKFEEDSMQRIQMELSDIY